jgi:hypothetical protein
MPTHSCSTSRDRSYHRNKRRGLNLVTIHQTPSEVSNVDSVRQDRQTSPIVWYDSSVRITPDSDPISYSAYIISLVAAEKTLGMPINQHKVSEIGALIDFHYYSFSPA